MCKDFGYAICWRALVLGGLSLSVLASAGCDSPIKTGGGVKLDGASPPDAVPGADVGLAPDAATPNWDSIDLLDADGGFDLTGGEIRRTGNEPSQSSNRHYMKSVRADYIASDWTYQITFHSPANAPDDIIFIGLGEAVPDSSFYNEPRNSVNFRIHQGATSFGNGWDVDVVAHDVGNLHWTYSNLGVGALPGAAGGTHTVQMSKSGAETTLEILDAGIVVTIPDLAVAAPFLYTGASRIFFGNASSAYSFDPPLLLLSP
jgi:hypothetical protein